MSFARHYDLKKSGSLDAYMKLLADHENPQAWDRVMCRNMISVSWDGRLFDCDFNQMLDLELKPDIWSIESFEECVEKEVILSEHCAACVAGAGSSCTGSTINF